MCLRVCVYLCVLCVLSLERKDKPNLLPFGPILIGMQFLTSGFLLPYVFTRSVETSTQAYQEDIDGTLYLYTKQDSIDDEKERWRVKDSIYYSDPF